MKSQLVTAIFFLIALWSCSEAPPSHPSSTTWLQISGRDESQKPIYRVRVPASWQHKLPSPTVSLSDTTQPICTFLIVEDADTSSPIRITIHNFPTDRIEESIPPKAQLARWQRQFSVIDAADILVTPQAYGGFFGLLFEGSGSLQNKEVTVLGWSMQIAPEHYRNLSYPRSAKEDHDFKQMRADYTIKVVGDPDSVKKHKRDIVAFARSFELIQEIPTDS